MKQKTWMALGLGAALLLTAAACSAGSSDSAEESESPAVEDETVAETLSLLTTFVDSEGQPLGGMIVRVDDGTEQLDYALDDEGGLTLADVSRTGTLELILLSDGTGEALTEDGEAVDDTTAAAADDDTTDAADPAADDTAAADDDETDSELTELARVTLVLSDGQVTDVVQEEDGSVSLSVTSDAESVSLQFTLDESGQLQCALSVADDTDAG